MKYAKAISKLFTTGNCREKGLVKKGFCMYALIFSQVFCHQYKQVVPAIFLFVFTFNCTEQLRQCLHLSNVGEELVGV